MCCCTGSEGGSESFPGADEVAAPPLQPHSSRHSTRSIEDLLFSSVVDPHFQRGSGYGSGSRSRVLMTKQLEKNLHNLFFIFWIENCNILIPRHPQGKSKLQEKSSSIKREYLQHVAIQNVNFLQFCG